MCYYTVTPIVELILASILSFDTPRLPKSIYILTFPCKWMDKPTVRQIHRWTLSSTTSITAQSDHQNAGAETML